MDWEKTISIIVGGLGGFISYAFDGNQYIEVLLWVITLDIITGVVASFVNPHLRFNSKHMYRGLCKKFIMLCMVSFSHQLDIMLHMNIICNTVTLYFIASDGFSCLENAGKCGVPLPHILHNSLEQLKKLGEQSEQDKKH